MPKIFKKNGRFICFAIGILVIFLLAGILLYKNGKKENQSVSPFFPTVYFEGEYRIGDGEWQDVVYGKHIPSTRGDVTLRGNFHMLSPNNEYIGLVEEGVGVSFYLDHINITIFEEGKEPHISDNENKLFGSAACGATWIAYSFSTNCSSPIEIVVHNPHLFGNEAAIDDMLSKMSVWVNMEFEREILSYGTLDRNMGLFFVIIALITLGIGVFSSLIHIPNSKIMWLLGIDIFCAGVYFVFNAEGVYFWNGNPAMNTTILLLSMILYSLFLVCVNVSFWENFKRFGLHTVAVLGILDILLLLLPIIFGIYLYDILPYWCIFQSIANIIVLVLSILEGIHDKRSIKWLYLSTAIPLICFEIDVFFTILGVWSGGNITRFVFGVLCLIAFVMMLRVIPHSYNATYIARELESEKKFLDAELAQSRISIMISQIRPHFIYNTLGSIEQLCEVDPPKAGELVHNFAKYLRGNFGELDNPKPILMSKEMEHVKHYISIENVRFPDMSFSFEMNSDDFKIPALTIQPIVENAIKHGLMKLQKGGIIKVTSYENDTHYFVSVEDDGVGFDISSISNDRVHVGLRNIRGRLEAMVNGTLEIESKVGVGTKVIIKIPKEDSV